MNDLKKREINLQKKIVQKISSVLEKGDQVESFWIFFPNRVNCLLDHVQVVS